MGVALGRSSAGGGDADPVEAERGKQGFDHIVAGPGPFLGEGVTLRAARGPEGAYFGAERPRRSERLGSGRIMCSEGLDPGLKLFPHAGGAEPPVRMDLGHDRREIRQVMATVDDRAHGQVRVMAHTSFGDVGHGPVRDASEPLQRPPQLRQHGHADGRGPMGVQHALGGTGGPRGVDDRGHVSGSHGFRCGVEVNG